MKVHKIIPVIVTAATVALGAAGCSGASTAQGGGGANLKSNVLTIGLPDGPQTNNGNPFDGTSAGTNLGYDMAIYEPLLMINDTRPAQPPIPWLAKSYKWNSSYTQIQFTARDGVKWSDGQPMTAADIAYSLELRKDNAALNTASLPYQSITTSGNTVTVTFSSSQYVNQIKVLQLFVVPKHIWQNIKNPATYLDPNPIGTGPYTLSSWTTQAVTLVRNKNYWGGQVAVPELRYTSYTDNTGLATALTTGAAQWGQAFIADYQQVLGTAKSNLKTFFPAGLGVDFLALNTTRAPFNDVAVRKAVNLVVDRAKASTIAESGIFPELTSSTGIPTPAGSSFISRAYQGQTYAVDVAAAKKILTDAGYTYAGSTLKDKSGKPVTVTLTDPSGWNDYDTDLTLIANSMKSIGIDATVENPNSDSWQTAVGAGNFDAALHWTDTGISPWTTYDDMFGPSYFLPLGHAAQYNFGRYQSPAASAAFKAFADATDAAGRQAALDTLQAIFVQDVPAIAVDARPALSEYSTKYWIGWPDNSNPYANPQITSPEAALVFTKLKPA